MLTGDLRAAYLEMAEALAAAPAETFKAFADRIDVSRPYISQRVADGTIRGAALVDFGQRRQIVPAIALRQLADAADPAKGGRGRPASSYAAAGHLADDQTGAELAADASLHAERTGKMRADRQRAELDLALRRGELIERTTIASVILPSGRMLTDMHKQALREAITRRLSLTEAEALMDAATERFNADILPNGGAVPAAA